MSTIKVTDNYVSKSNILCLDIDCLEELFEWLSFRNLLALRGSCKRMRQAVDYYIKTTFPLGFGTLEIGEEQIEDLRRLDSTSKPIYNIKLFKHIQFNDNLFQICSIKNGLEHVEKMTLTSLRRLDNYFIDRLLHSSERLKSFQINGYSNENSGAVKWMQLKYSQLEHFGLTTELNGRNINLRPELPKFFELNPNIRRFSTDMVVLYGYAELFMQANIKLDQLDLEVDINDKNFNDRIFIETCNILGQLHTRGFYKKLHLYVYSIYHSERVALNHIAEIPGLEKFFIEDSLLVEVWPPFMELKELSIDKHDFEMIAEKIINIEKVYVESGSLGDLLPLIHTCAKLTKLKFEKIWPGCKYLDKCVIDLPALNEERAKCSNGSKITIYVGDLVYFATKQALMRTDFALVELKRMDSYEWELHFDSKRMVHRRKESDYYMEYEIIQNGITVYSSCLGNNRIQFLN